MMQHASAVLRKSIVTQYKYQLGHDTSFCFTSRWKTKFQKKSEKKLSWTDAFIFHITDQATEYINIMRELWNEDLVQLLYNHREYQEPL